MPSPSVRLMVLALLSATPTLAHAATIERPLPPPPAPMTAAYLAPFAPQQRMNWLNECHNRLTRGENPISPPSIRAARHGCVITNPAAPLIPPMAMWCPWKSAAAWSASPARRQPDRARTVVVYDKRIKL
jgi:hypothetical protein